MTTDTPIVTRALVELTFANGVTRRLILDDKDAVVACNLDVTNDIRETTPDDASWRTFEAGPRQKVDVHLVGRGPRQFDIPDPREAIDELRAQLTVHQQRRDLILRELAYVTEPKEAVELATLIKEHLNLDGCEACPPGCPSCPVDPECGCDVHLDDAPAAVPAVPVETLEAANG